MVLGIGVGFVYWAGWPQPAMTIYPMPSTRESGIPASNTVSSGSPGQTLEVARQISSGGREAVDLLYDVADEQKIQPGEATAFLVDLNEGTSAELEQLPGIGAVLAGRIVAHRTAHGAFRRVEDLMLVPGIGKKRFQQLRPLVGVRKPVKVAGNQ